MHKRSVKFGFVIYPDSFERLYSFSGVFRFLIERIPKAHLKNHFAKSAPRVMFRSKIKSLTGFEVEGIFVLCPLFPDQFVSFDNEYVNLKISESVLLAKKYGAQVVGLAGFSSILSNQGLNLINHVGVPLTTGNTLTSSLALEGVTKAVRLMDYDIGNIQVAIVGALGDIGQACAEDMAGKVKKLILVAKDNNKLQEYAGALKKDASSEVISSTSVSDFVYDSDVIILCTSSLTTILNPNILKSGSIVCDISVPANIARNITEFRKDILVFEGGYAKLQSFLNIKSNPFKMQFRHSSIFGCLAETLILAFEKRFENYSIGRGNITSAKVIEINALGKRNGVELAPFFCGDKVFNEEDLLKIKDSRKSGICK